MIATMPLSNVACLIPYIEPGADSVVRVDDMRDSHRSTRMGFKEVVVSTDSECTRVLATAYERDEHRAKLRAVLFPIMGCRACVEREPMRQIELHIPRLSDVDRIEADMPCRIRFMDAAGDPTNLVECTKTVFCGEAKLNVRYDRDACRIDLDHVALGDCDGSQPRIIVSGRVEAQCVPTCR